jgi:hypothetical protein
MLLMCGMSGMVLQVVHRVIRHIMSGMILRWILIVLFMIFHHCSPSPDKARVPQSRFIGQSKTNPSLFLMELRTLSLTLVHIGNIAYFLHRAGP